MSDKKMVDDVMKDTRQKTNKVGKNPALGGQPGNGAGKHEGSKSSHAMKGFQIGSRVTSKETRKR